jgi:hypothetical protein
MPRRTRPKYGIDPVQNVSAFSFAESQIERLLGALPSVRGKHDEIVARLTEVARSYSWHHNQNQAKPTRGEQNAALTEVGHLAQELEMRLRTLDMDTECLRPKS